MRALGARDSLRELRMQLVTIGTSGVPQTEIPPRVSLGALRRRRQKREWTHKKTNCDQVTKSETLGGIKKRKLAQTRLSYTCQSRRMYGAEETTTATITEGLLPHVSRDSWTVCLKVRPVRHMKPKFSRSQSLSS